MSDKRSWYILRTTGYGETVVYGTDAEAEDRRIAEEERRGNITRKQLADPSNRTHCERVAEELKVQRKLRESHSSSYGDVDLPELAESVKQ